ncbi:ribokinase [Aestuariispira insulae]|uniref:Ribokinase n=1 Tax=Aestuariispira insulae TaxID=1461337 RepID=A0A3D9HHU8_9PROT|nr:ribokinase [Aestuariispira insulae]RED49048.1 ribokinase [Aestuariispira insulae]
MSIAVFGSINIDITAYLDRHPVPGETLMAEKLAMAMGGKGANQAIAASRLGLDTWMIGAVGDDSHGETARKTLAEERVYMALAEHPEETTGLALIDVASDGSNSIRIASGANGLVDVALAERYRDVIVEADLLLLQNEVPLAAALAAARIAKTSGTTVVMDPAPMPKEAWNEETLEHFDILTPNQHEVAVLIGWEPATLDQARQAAAEIVSNTGGSAIVTMGGLGAAWCHDGATGQVAAPCVDVVDTVAAGDCFNAALAVGLARKMAFEEAVAFASHAGALATTRPGAAVAAPSFDEVMRFVNSGGHAADDRVQAAAETFAGAG